MNFLSCEVTGRPLLSVVVLSNNCNKYTLLYVLLCGIAEYFYELCQNQKSKYKQQVNFLSDTTQQNVQ